MLLMPLLPLLLRSNYLPLLGLTASNYGFYCFFCFYCLYCFYASTRCRLTRRLFCTLLTLLASTEHTARLGPLLDLDWTSTTGPLLPLRTAVYSSLLTRLLYGPRLASTAATEANCLD
uniref:Secreted protein n=1 Tax=Knipowitschia caucasica TaxID=637954 RepID=A0AAV2IVY1_KNICA